MLSVFTHFMTMLGNVEASVYVAYLLPIIELATYFFIGLVGRATVMVASNMQKY